MTTFALVHGAWHGAWCWERLLEPLERRGHGAVAVDLPSEDLDAGLDAYADVVAAFLAPVEDDVIVVGHSLNGLIVPLVAARRRVEAVVYLTGFVPVEGQSMNDQFASAPAPVLLFDDRPQPDGKGRSHWPDEAAATRALSPDLTSEDVHWAFSQLARAGAHHAARGAPQPFPPVRSVATVGTGDTGVNPAWARRVTRERLGADAVELDSGHFPMITDPEALADALDAVS